MHPGEHSSKQRGSESNGGGWACAAAHSKTAGSPGGCWGEGSAGVSSERPRLEATVTESLQSTHSEVESDKVDSKLKTFWSVEPSGP